VAGGFAGCRCCSQKELPQPAPHTHHRDTRALLAAGKDAEAQAFIADNAHPRLWRLLAEHALQRLDLPTAEKGFVQCRDYQGVQLVKRIAALPDRQKQQAEVCARVGARLQVATAAVAAA
jgi:hypothetical protein